jgi:heptosyltransferase I
MTPSPNGCSSVHAPFRVLILKPSSLGDVVQALPVLRLLKRHRPESAIYWWVSDALASLLEGDPDLAGLYRFSRKGWSSPRRWRGLIRQVLELRRMRFDWVLDLQGLARSGGIAWLTNGAFTVGLDDAREGARGFYDVAVPRGSEHTHAVDWYLGVLRALGVPTEVDYEWLPPRPAAALTVREKAGAEGIWVGLQPGARWLNKRWPVDSYADLVKHLHRDWPSIRFAVLGGMDDRELGRVLASAVPGAVLDLTGRTTLPEMVEWVRRCAVLVTNDTGPMHVAAALKRPVVALFGPTEPRRTGPYGQLDGVMRRAELPCVPCMSDRCHHTVPFDCLRGIGVEAVAARVEAWLGADGAAGWRLRPPK